MSSKNCFNGKLKSRATAIPKTIAQTANRLGFRKRPITPKVIAKHDESVEHAPETNTNKYSEDFRPSRNVQQAYLIAKKADAIRLKTDNPNAKIAIQFLRGMVSQLLKSLMVTN